MAIANTNLVKGIFTDGQRLAGEIPQMHDGVNVVTYAGKDAITFGNAVMEGSNADEGLQYSGAGNTFIGIATMSKDGSQADANDIIVGYALNDALAVIQSGLVVVRVSEAVDIGDPVRVLHTGALNGDFLKTASAGNSALIGGAKFKSKTTGAGLAIVELGGFTAFTITDDV